MLGASFTLLVLVEPLFLMLIKSLRNTRYILSDNELIIDTSVLIGGSKRISMDTIESVEKTLYPFGFKLFGASFHGGSYRIPGLGRAFIAVTNLDDAILIKTTQSNYIISPKNPMDFLEVLKSKIIQVKNPTLQNKEEVAEAVGVASIIFNDLKNNRIKDVIFNWDEILNFNGETGPYLQYTYARIRSLLKKFQNTYGRVEFRDGLPWGDEGYSLILLINDFESTVVKSSEGFEPSIISRYLLEITSQFNSFYNTHRVVSDNFSLSLARALIVRGVMKVLEEGLSLLGITAVNEM